MIKRQMPREPKKPDCFHSDIMTHLILSKSKQRKELITKEVESNNPIATNCNKTVDLIEWRENIYSAQNDETYVVCLKHIWNGLLFVQTHRTY
ncbi:hypothetical protein CEXT_771211 [Caerostris extrusa]|uniref:Uncharacterized protein n=1 Tax=Caerostris extrusa TaxID=172846 RepID=A0AAV4PRM5_CAEEX|nr:hypothetical protein CEXT_771211 [Caerostris extrusa]